jgi:hypothetical protein
MNKKVFKYLRGGMSPDGALTQVVLSVADPPTPENANPDKHDLAMQFRTPWLRILIARLLEIGVHGAKRHGIPEVPQDGREFVPTPLSATMPTAHIGAGDEVVLTLQFGAVAIGATVTRESAQGLLTQLQQILSTPEAPTGRH